MITTSHGSPNGKIRVQVHKGDQRLDQHSSLSKGDVGQEQWKRYLDTHSGRHDFQIDLALSIMNYGIGLQWDGESATRPNFLRQTAFVPCDCG
jgi:hypothetical protein